ncbi:hypothetical protein [Acetivibrio saccincola]|uniref:Uncharacterized protein n=1 Tax=Acetivibrio saccincola TaxID=1677857 RepID=A0A2K9E7H4_9FIRM|nr:hypothetical protein [Acetivibrio saccincola]AUG57486.1 hypothetical protein HVS_07875 [Acetivibrio saccincola]
MDYRKLMDLVYVELVGLTEPEANSLRLYFKKCKISGKSENLIINKHIIENLYPIIEDEKMPVIQMDFDSYIAYSVTNESFTSWDDYEEFEGKAFRIYKRSRYLDFIKVHTFACDDYPGHFEHYGIVCLDHIVNVVSVEKPVINEVKMKIP